MSVSNLAKKREADVSPGSFIRSAARATFSAYRRVPVRWRLAGGSAALTCVILASFAAIVGALADGQVRDAFLESMNTTFQNLPQNVAPVQVKHGATECEGNLIDLAFTDSAQIRLFDNYGDTLCSSAVNAHGRPVNDPQLMPPPGIGTGSTVTYGEAGQEVFARWISWGPINHGWLLYARPLSQIDQTVSRIRVFLVLGVLGGAILALLAGLYVARRAMRPISELSEVAREIELTRDPTRRIPHPEARDEVSELARTLEGMLASLAAARADTEAALTRQREFVADASHELRTPLTSVLANLELLADELAGEQAESAKSALRSTRRMRRLVGDLLLLARADARREAPQRPTDLAEVLRDAAGELGPVAEDHELTVFPGPAVVDANRDEVHRLILNLLENALNHTAPGTAIRARTALAGASAVLIVEDEGPGIPADLRERVFDRFVRGHGDGGRGTGLGLAIVRAVADSHRAEVTLTSPAVTGGAGGTRFEIRFPAVAQAPTSAQPGAPEPVVVPGAQTSTTTGRTIGRRLRRS
ncbi:cell wall metabolism sensor histidine kinase WalK [Conexibacter sp. DBS9H8]|uniref:sensor histidine kinase n=1 Tax=Conexibacter sp. DBS9H8 TaxID=2937801 RepID=UPI00201060FA|nr:HAMP domain-containing sensor histidine kinase [Conexibacter sp. DBS9H8]